jgi:hypothetical protein
VGDLPIRIRDWQQEPILLALRPRHDGEGMIARYWNALGVHQRTTLDIERGVKRVWRCDLMERPVEELPIRVVTRKKPVTVITIPIGKPDPKQPENRSQVSYEDETNYHVSLEIAPYAVVTLLIEFES